MITPSLHHYKVATSAARPRLQSRTPNPIAKTKNSSNKERGSVLKSIDKLTTSLDGDGGGSGADQPMMSILAMQRYYILIN